MSLTTKLQNLIPISSTEKGWRYNGPFSTYPEWHAFTLGVGAGITGSPELQALVVAFAMGNGARKKADDQHWKDVGKEPAYALGGIVIGTLLRHAF